MIWGSLSKVNCGALNQGNPCLTTYQDPNTTGVSQAESLACETSVAGVHAKKLQQSEFDDHMLTDVGAPKHIYSHLSERTQEDKAEKCRSECFMPDRKYPNQPTCTSSEILVRTKRFVGVAADHNNRVQSVPAGLRNISG